MQNWSQGDVQLNGLRLHYYRSGGGRPPLVLAHGFTDNALYWTRTAQALRADWDVVAYDARGHGQSQGAGGCFDEQTRAADLVGLVRALGLRRPALVGHSMGAATIARAAADDPGLAACLVLEDPAWSEPPPRESPEAARARREQRRAYRDDWRAWVAGLQRASLDDGLAQIRAHSPGWSPQDQRLSLNARRQVELALFDHYPTAEAPWRSVLARIECPILLLLGDDRARGAIITAELAREAAGLWQRGRWTLIPGAGHSIRYDQFEAYLAEVQGFLRQVRSGSFG
jgi:N-formylmaleamate deformylase